MRLLISLVFTALFFTISSIAQPRPEWNNVFDEHLMQYGEGMIAADDGFAVIGISMQASFWLLKTDEGGQSEWEVDLERVGDENRGWDIACTNDGGFIVCGTCFLGGMNCWLVMRVNEDGDEVWTETYRAIGQDRWLSPVQVLALDEDRFLLAGDGDGNAMVMMIDGEEGEVIWETVFEDELIQTFTDVVAVDDGYVLCGKTFAGENNEDINAWLVKFDEEGNETWQQEYDFARLEVAKCICEAEDGGFILGCDRSNLQNDQQEDNIQIIKVGDDGDFEWQVTYDVQGYQHIKDIARNPEGGYTLAGSSQANPVDQNPEYTGYAKRINEEGEELWEFTEGAQSSMTSFNELQVLPDGSIVLEGHYRTLEPRCIGVMLVKLSSENIPPEITERQPVEESIFLMTDSEQAFSIDAEDDNMDELQYKWLLDGERISEENQVLVDFPDAGVFELWAYAADAILSDSTGWTITVFDSLTVVRSPENNDVFMLTDHEQEFTVSLEGIDEDFLSFMWVLGEDTTGDRDEFSCVFEEAGEYSLQATVSVGELSASTDWSLTVLTTLIDSYQPQESEQSIMRGDSISFAVEPAIDHENLLQTWYLNEEEIGTGMAVNVTFPDTGRYEVMSITAIETLMDTVRWTVTVDEESDIPGSDIQTIENYILYPPAPNPFNSTTTIRYNLPEPGPVSLKVYDVSGKQAASLFEGYSTAGAHTFSFNCEKIPSGVYIVKLNAGGLVLTRKVMVVR